ncbi:transglutaminase-like cysteine peptidase [Aestuariivirga litoralis]|nr:transglutaminase-like cysteine peptidase [Aestuariivirga litoralis]
MLVGCCVGQWAAAEPGQGQAGQAAGPLALVEFEPAKMPSGLVELCGRDASFCAPAAAPVQVLALSTQRWQLLRSVNDGVNHRISSSTDRQLYGRDEYWTIPTTAGDCEDYVLLKRQILLQSGFGPGQLLITVVHDENGEAHAVLTVPSDQGDLVLDNRRDEVLHWWQTGYSFIKRQSEANPAAWVALGSDKLQATNIASGPGLP